MLQGTHTYFTLQHFVASSAMQLLECFSSQHLGIQDTSAVHSFMALAHGVQYDLACHHTACCNAALSTTCRIDCANAVRCPVYAQLVQCSCYGVCHPDAV